MSSNESREQAHIRGVLIPELLADFETWGREYQQERDLGMKGEFANLYRKARKLKTIVWDGADASGWREGLRTIVKEVAAHALLMLVDIDFAASEPPQTTSVAGGVVRFCGPACSPKHHVFAGECLYRRAGSWLAPAEGAS